MSCMNWFQRCEGRALLQSNSSSPTSGDPPHSDFIITYAWQAKSDELQALQALHIGLRSACSDFLCESAEICLSDSILSAHTQWLSYWKKTAAHTLLLS